ncbi:MAG: hypothetical protein H0V10_11180 [Geodermatophilaceae bacterium]|nr:hypothetical protein [Geodermatophilaceae bacterium]
MPHPAGPSPRPTPGPSWESFATSALWRLVGLLCLLVLVLGLLTWSWDVALNTARLALLVLFVLSSWLYIIWFRQQRAQLTHRDEASQDRTKDYRLS